MASELVADARHLEQGIATVEAHSNTTVAQANTSLVQLFGVGPVLAARFLGEVGDIRRFPRPSTTLPPTPAPPRWRPPAAR